MNNSVDHVGDTDTRLPSDADRINMALRYGTDPLSKKTVVFCWLDRGLPWEGVKYLSKRRLKLKGSTTRVYRHHWTEMKSGPSQAPTKRHAVDPQTDERSGMEKGQDDREN